MKAFVTGGAEYLFWSTLSSIPGATKGRALETPKSVDIHRDRKSYAEGISDYSYVERQDH
jgi:hypothetical protein